jgi:acyl carrier protein
MEKLVAELREILEVMELPLDARFEDLPEWDSLNALSVIALLDSSYGIQIDAAGLQKFGSINEFVQHVLASRK